MQTETLTLNGHPFFVRRWGDPDLPPLILLHGFPEYSGAWEDLAPHLADRFHCIAPDLRGYGQSWVPEGIKPYGATAVAEDIVALIDTLGRGPVSILGHDWGSAVAYALAMFHGDRVERLIVLNGVHPVPFQRAMAAGGAQSAASQYIETLRSDGSETWLAENDFAKLLQLFSANMDLSWLTPERLEAYKTEWRRPGRLKAMVNWYRASPLVVAKPGHPITVPAFPPEKLMVHCPHLVVWGVRDTALLPSSLSGLQDYAPDLTLARIGAADHWLHHQVPEQVASIVLDWAGPT